MACSKTIPGTITNWLTQLGLSPVECVFTKYVSCHSMCHDGVIVNLYIVLILLSHGLMSI